MAMFIDVEVDPVVSTDPALVKTLIEACPVDIFASDEQGRLTIVEQNLDECTLCDLCKDAAPEGTVRVIKLYED
jgi:NAD-dependent dihydropyrimidine dehydrogenase PreA subunit